MGIRAREKGTIAFVSVCVCVCVSPQSVMLGVLTSLSTSLVSATATINAVSTTLANNVNEVFFKIDSTDARYRTAIQGLRVS